MGALGYAPPAVAAPQDTNYQAANEPSTPYFNPTGPQNQQFAPKGNGGIDSSLASGVQGALNQPSRYDSQLVQDTYNRLGGQIDDQYNAADQALQGNLARRGLGSEGDTTIGANDARYQNLQRRTAKSDLANSLAMNVANTQGADRSAALAAAMGYTGQQYGQQLDTAGFNNAANQQNFGNQLSTAGFNNAAGQQSFNNQLATSQYNSSQDQQNQALLLKLLGY